MYALYSKRNKIGSFRVFDREYIAQYRGIRRRKMGLVGLLCRYLGGLSRVNGMQ